MFDKASISNNHKNAEITKMITKAMFRFSQNSNLDKIFDQFINKV